MVGTALQQTNRNNGSREAGLKMINKIDLIESLVKKIIFICSALVLVACASGSTKVDSRLQTTGIPPIQ